jgi:hypothetical protein
MKNKKTFKLLQVTSVILLTLTIINLMTIPTVLATTSLSQATSCCEKTIEGASCINIPKENCNTEYASAPTSCESTSFCETGTCYNPREGNCIQNTPKSTCESNNGVWSEEDIGQVPQCQLGCCVISDQAAFVSKTRCSRLSSFVGVQADYFTDINDEFSCILLAQGSQMGSCVFDQGPDRTCQFTSRQDCDGEESFLGLNESNNNGKKFYADVLCSAEELGTNCEKQYKTTCDDGKVYWQDSCGNQENIYSSDSTKSYNEGRVAEDDDVCSPVAGSRSCGNCDYLMGGICAEEENNFGEAGVNNFCQATTCRDRDGQERKNGESWCVYDGKIGSGADTAGSRHFREICLNGEIITTGCADYRNEICIHEELDNGFDVAACRVNLWQDCTSQEKKADCLNADSRDCVWYSSVTGIDLSGSNSYSSGASNYDSTDTTTSSGFTGSAIVGTGKGKSEYDVDITVIDTTEDRNESTNGLCVPKFPPGLRFWDSGAAASQCAQASATCTIEWEESMDIKGEKEWKIKDGSECLDSDKTSVSQTWAEQANQVCVAMGDCGGYINFQGKFTQDGYVLKNPDGIEDYLDANSLNRINIMSLGGIFSMVGNAIFELVSGGKILEDVEDDVDDFSDKTDASTGFLNELSALVSETWIISPGLRAYNKGASQINSLKSTLKNIKDRIDANKNRLAGLEGEKEKKENAIDKTDDSPLEQNNARVALDDEYEQLEKDLKKANEDLIEQREKAQTKVNKAQTQIDEYEKATEFRDGNIMNAAGLRATNFVGASMDAALKSIALGEAAKTLLISFGTHEEDAEAQGLGIAAALATYKTLGNLFDEKTGLVRNTPVLDNVAFKGIVSLAAGWWAYTDAYEDSKTKEVTFECKPWQAPIGQDECDQCSANDLQCSEYRCKSLGPSCGMINEGTSQADCIDMSPKDASGPIISPSEEKLTDGFAYSGISDYGFTIEKAGGGCLPAFSSLQWGVKTDEPAQCKIDIRHTTSFKDMRYYLGGDNTYMGEHEEFLGVPNSNDLANLSAGGIEIKNGNEMEIYIRCRDGNANANSGEGNMNEAEYAVRFCVDPTADITPPQIISSSVSSGSCVAANQNTADVTFYTNEPASCSWDVQDRSKFSDFQYQMRCSRDAVDTGKLMVYPCSATLTGINSENTPFYIRCEDKAGNDNDASYNFSLSGSNPLKMMNLAPNETIRSGTNLAQVNLYAETIFGCGAGRAVCFYSQTGNQDDFITFKDTDTDDGVHTQQLYLEDGQHTISFRCVDAGGNVAENTTSFEVDVNTNPPSIIRVYEDSDLLKIMTDRDATCSFTTSDCNFLVDEGEKLITATGSQNIHMTEWVKNIDYYIKCKDNFNNEALDCSTIVRPIDNFL